MGFIARDSSFLFVKPLGIVWLTKQGGEMFRGEENGTIGIFTLYLAEAMPNLTSSGNIHTLAHI